MEKDLLQYLIDDGILIADGATGTALMAAGLPSNAPPDSWNILRPDEILALHRSYLDAGSQIILTNTFGGNRIKLDKFKMGDHVYKHNLAAAVLARGEASGKAYVAGDIGPTGELMEPYGVLNLEKAIEVFAEQASALAEGGVDAIWVETMSDIKEAQAAIMGAKQVTDLPILCSLSFGKKARTMMGAGAREAAETLWPLGLTAIGANCGERLEDVYEVLSQMKEVLPDAPLIAKPNAGTPRLVSGQTVYDMTPGEFSSHIRKFVQLGARIVGACCGSNPSFIKAIAKVLQ